MRKGGKGALDQQVVVSSNISLEAAASLRTWHPASAQNVIHSIKPTIAMIELDEERLDRMRQACIAYSGFNIFQCRNPNKVLKVASFAAFWYLNFR